SALQYFVERIAVHNQVKGGLFYRGQIKNLLSQEQHMLSGVANIAERIPLLVIERAQTRSDQDIDIPSNHGERVPQVVCNQAEEPILFLVETSHFASLAFQLLFIFIAKTRVTHNRQGVTLAVLAQGLELDVH